MNPVIIAKDRIDRLGKAFIIKIAGSCIAHKDRLIHRNIAERKRIVACAFNQTHSLPVPVSRQDILPGHAQIMSHLIHAHILHLGSDSKKSV